MSQVKDVVDTGTILVQGTPSISMLKVPVVGKRSPVNVIVSPPMIDPYLGLMLAVSTGVESEA